MLPYSGEHSIFEGQLEVKQLFDFVVNNAEGMDAYSMEPAIFARIMGIGLAAMKGYFAEKGTGDVGDVLELVSIQKWPNFRVADKPYCNLLVIRAFKIDSWTDKGSLGYSWTKFGHTWPVVLFLTSLNSVKLEPCHFFSGKCQ